MKYHVPVSIIIVILFTITLSSCSKDTEQSEIVETNENILQSKSFHIKSDSTGLETSVSGTVFLSGEEGVPGHAQIVALLEIDPNDWGGVVFYIPNQWYISSVTSSYPEENKGEIPEDGSENLSEDFVAVWTTADRDYEWNAMIEIGRDRSYTPTGGGKGAVMIELDRNEEWMATSDVFRILVGVGSIDNDGVHSVHPDYEVIEISIP